MELRNNSKKMERMREEARYEKFSLETLALCKTILTLVKM